MTKRTSICLVFLCCFCFLLGEVGVFGMAMLIEVLGGCFLAGIERKAEFIERINGLIERFRGFIERL